MTISNELCAKEINQIKITVRFLKLTPAQGLCPYKLLSAPARSVKQNFQNIHSQKPLQKKKNLSILGLDLNNPANF